MDRYGFPRTGAKRQRIIQSFQTGDLVKAVVTSGRKMGVYMGRAGWRCEQQNPSISRPSVGQFRALRRGIARGFSGQMAIVI
jgi:hypothetical protein